MDACTSASGALPGAQNGELVGAALVEVAGVVALELDANMVTVASAGAGSSGLLGSAGRPDGIVPLGVMAGGAEKVDTVSTVPESAVMFHLGKSWDAFPNCSDQYAAAQRSISLYQT